MIIFDFLLYNLTHWYMNRENQLTWSTPLERAIYVSGIIVLLWLTDFWIILNTFLLKNDELQKSFVLIFVILGLGIMQGFTYIYKKRGRFEKINNALDKPFDVSDKVGQIFCIILLFLPLIMFGILLVTT